MADIPTANIDKTLHFSMGTLKAWKARVKGDGAGVTISVPFSRVEGYWVCTIDETAAHKISESSGVLTYAAAPSNGLYHWLFVVGY